MGLWIPGPGTREYRVREFYRWLEELPPFPGREQLARERSGVTDEDLDFEYLSDEWEAFCYSNPTVH